MFFSKLPEAYFDFLALTCPLRGENAQTSKTPCFFFFFFFYWPQAAHHFLIRTLEHKQEITFFGQKLTCHALNSQNSTAKFRPKILTQKIFVLESRCLRRLGVPPRPPLFYRRRVKAIVNLVFGILIMLTREKRAWQVNFWPKKIISVEITCFEIVTGLPFHRQPFFWPKFCCRRVILDQALADDNPKFPKSRWDGPADT